MSRLIPMALVCAVGFAVSPQAQAGGTPSAFDPVFSPASYRTQYGPYDSGYTSYSTGYTPYYTGYTPYYAGFAGFFGIPTYSASYAPTAGCGCQPSSCCGGYSGCSSCGTGCASGNCSTGNCASGNCASGCATTTNMIGPVPDPAYQNKGIDTRQGPTKTYANDGFKSRINNEYPNGGAATGSGTDNSDFKAPKKMFSEDQSGDSGENEARKVPLAPPPKETDKDKVIPSKQPAPAKSVNETRRTLPLDSRVTSRAVSPRERQSIDAEKPVVAATRKRTGSTIEVDAGLRTTDVGRY